MLNGKGLPIEPKGRALQKDRALQGGKFRVKNDDRNAPEKHERDEFSPNEYSAGEQSGGPRGYSLQFDDDDRDPWNYGDDYRRDKDLDDEDDDYLKDEDDMDTE